LNYTDSNGKRVRKFFAKAYQAKEERKKLRGESNDMLGVLKDLDDAQKLRLVQAWQTSIDAGFDLLDACVGFNKEHEPTKVINLADCRKEFIISKEKIGLRHESIKSYNSTFNNFGKKFDKKPIHEITKEMIQKWILPQNYSPIRFNRLLADMRTLYKWAEKQGYRTNKRNPFDIDKIKIDQTDVSIIAIDDVEPYLRKAIEIPELGAVVVLVLFCGLRVSEAIQMKWDNIDLDDGIITVPGGIAKLRVKRICEPEENAIEWLKYAKEQGGLLQLSQSVFDKKRRAHLPQQGANALRHSFCSYHLAYLKNIGLTAEEAGNSPEMIRKHYKEAVRGKNAKRFFNLKP